MLSAVLSIEPRPVDPFELRVPVIRRVMPRITPPLDLSVIPFRYRDSVPGKPKCSHARRRSRARS
jgi:hypothetical protein